MKSNIASVTKALLLSALLFSTAACGSTKTEEKRMTGQPYGECVSKLLEPSRALILKMKNDGVDLSKERLVTHLLVGPDDAIIKASKLFSERGFDILESGNARLLLGDLLPLSDERVSQIVPAMCHKAEEFGLSYDGWDVDMAKG